jgi:membrane protease YdiL (CAAX protease family)
MKKIFIARDGRVRATWRFHRGVLAVVGAELLSGATAGFIAGRDAPAVYVFLQQPMSLALMIAGFSLLLTVADKVDEGKLAAQGFPTHGAWFRQVVDGTLLGAGMVTACVLAIRVGGDVQFTMRPSVRGFVAVGLLALLIAVAAMKEEVAFRGYPFQRLVEAGGPRWGPWLGIFVLSVLFGLVHWNNPSRTVASTANTVVIGALLALAYLRTGAIWLPFGIHFGWNFMRGVVFGLAVSGITDFAVLVQGRAQGPVWLTGGGYGIEGSAVATVVILLGIVPIVRLYRRPAAGLEVIPGYGGLARNPARGTHAGPDGGIQF